MKLKVIVLDIDGTLINSKKQLTDKTKAALLDAQNKGIKVILASGRPTTGMMELAHALEMHKHHGLLISFNGSQVLDCESNEILFNQTMPIEDTQRLLNHLKKFDIIPMVIKDDYIYVNDVYNCFISLKDNPKFNIVQYESRDGGFKLCEIDDLSKFTDFPQNKILVAGNPEYLIENYKAMSEPFAGTLNSMFTAPMYYEYTALGIDKAKALDFVLNPLGITRKEVISFGDGHNDIPIIQYAGHGVAMGNAVKELKDIANEVTLSNDEDGIAYILNKYI